MPLNIYTIKHPLVLNWASSLSSTNTTLEEFDLVKKIVLVLIYEATRKFIEIHELYLKRIDDVEEIHIIKNKFSYCIITNKYFSQISGGNILSLLPQASIYNFSLGSEDPAKEIQEKLGIIGPPMKIILLQKRLDNTIITAINNLMLDLNIASDDLQICCVTCSSKNLEILSKTQPNLRIYTIKITDS